MRLTKDDIRSITILETVKGQRFVVTKKAIDLERLCEVVKELEKDFKDDIDLYGTTYCLGMINKRFGEVME